MSTDFMSPDDLPAISEDQPEAAGGSLQIQTRNSNLGAMRVAVPRDMGKVMRGIDQQAQVFGHKWVYRLPFKNKKTGETTYVEGPTVGCALDVARCYGNNSVEVERVDETAQGWVFHAVFLDIETGFRLCRPFRQRKDQNIGGMGGDFGRAEDIVFQIGASKAMRNVVRNALRGLLDEAIERGNRRLTAKIENDPEKAIAWIRKQLTDLDVDESRVAHHFGQPIEKLKADKLAQIVKLLQAVADGAMKVDEFCPDPIDVKEIVEDDKPEADPVKETEKKTNARLKFRFQGRDLGKGKFITNLRQSAKEAADLTTLAELHNEATHTVMTAELSDDAAEKVKAEVRGVIEKARAVLMKAGEESEETDEGDGYDEDDEGDEGDMNPTFDLQDTDADELD